MTMINNAWKLTDESKQGQGTKGWGNAKPRAKQDNNIFNRPDPTEKKAEDKDLDLNASQQQLKDHIRKRIAARGARGLMGIAKKFKIADDNGNGTLDVQEFNKDYMKLRIKYLGKLEKIINQEISFYLITFINSLVLN